MQNAKLQIKIQNFKKELPKIKKNVFLTNYTSFKIGGKAKYFYEAKTKQDLIKAIQTAKNFGLSFSLLAGGSNILVSDKGYDGLVIKLQITNYKLQTKQPYSESQTSFGLAKFQIPKIYVEAGISLSSLVSGATKNNLTGLEWAVGIPGTIGGAIRGNAGAFGGSMAEIVKEVEVIKIQNSKFKIQKYQNKNCRFKYRDSIFKRNKNLIIISAILQLKKGNKLEIEKKIEKYLVHRKKFQPLKFPSAGSIFKNQKSKIKNQKLLNEFPLLIKFNQKGEIPAGFLIEKAGLKGKRLGGAQISKKHANFIINLGGAKAKEVMGLINLIKKEVKKQFNIALKEEIQYI